MSREQTKGLAKAKMISEDRSYWARQLNDNGEKVIGYLCIYPPLEMITALDLVPYRLFGSIREPITKADACLPSVVCPFLRSVLDLGLKGKYDFLSGVVMPHACEVGEKLAHIWQTYMHPPFSFYIDTPHKKQEAALEYHIRVLYDFKKSLETFTGNKLTVDKLTRAISVHNEQRRLVRELYQMRKPDPPLISGVETLLVMKALMSIPLEEGNKMLREVISEVKERKNGPEKGVRLLIWGSILDDVALLQVIEQFGANVVIDDTCVGSRFYFPDVVMDTTPLDALARRYLVDLKCPRTFVGAALGETKKDFLTDLEGRFGYLRQYADDWNVKGIILYGLRYCDIHGYEVPLIADFLDHVLPSMYLEHDYSEASLAPLRTRMQAFIEVLV